MISYPLTYDTLFSPQVRGSGFLPWQRFMRLKDSWEIRERMRGGPDDFLFWQNKLHTYLQRILDVLFFVFCFPFF